MSIVRIPTTHFIISAKRQYTDIDTAIVREAIQNSIDAGATNIAIETGLTWCKITDNGCGMTEEVLTNAMLTMSGSHKSNSGAIGGFGAAKEILLFMHQKYELHTLDNQVNGSVLEYELIKTNFIQGTAITMHFHESYNFNQESFVNKAVEWLKNCDTTAIITINGNQVSHLSVLHEVKDLGWGKLYCEDCSNINTHMVIRIKGVCMFRSYIGNINKKIVLEITNPSTEILTSNRDGLQWAYSDIVQKLIEEITIDKKSFGRLHNTITCISGNSRSFINTVLRVLIQEPDQLTTTGTSVRSALTELENAIQTGAVTQDDAIIRLREMSKDMSDGWVITQKLEEYINEVDFYIQINDSGYEKIPEEISPSMKMKSKYRKLACLWKAALKHVFKSNNMSANYCIGWIIDKQALAKYVRSGGIEKFLLNPYLVNENIDIKNKKEMVHNILMSAAHEVAHRTFQYHDESFVGSYEKLLLKSISSLSSYRTLLIAAESETL